ncbi:OFA family MFS transporter [Virgibacillus soli]
MTELQHQNNSQAYMVAVSGTVINLCLGVLYAWSVFSKELQDQLGMTATETSLPYSVAIALFAFFMVPAGIMLDRLGPRLLLLLSGFLIGIGFVIAGLTLNVVGLVIGFGIVAGAAMGFGYAAPTPVAAKWFKPHLRGTITGIVVSGYGLAAVYVSPLADYLIQGFGVANAFYYLGAFFTILIVIASMFMKSPPEGWKPVGGEPPKPKIKANGEQEKEVVRKDYSPGEMMKTFQFWSLWVMYAFSASAGLIIIGHVAKIAQTQGGLETGFLFAALLAIGNAGGRIVTGAVSDKIGRSATLILVFILQAINMFAFITYTSGPMLTFGAIVTGATYGALLALFPATTWDWFGLKNSGTNYGLMFTAWGVGGLVGPLMAGRIIDATGGYDMVYIVSAILLLVAAGLGFITKAPKVEYVEEDVDDKVASL